MYLPIQGAAKIKKLWRLLKMKNKEKHLNHAGNMKLSKEDVDLYYKLHWSLLFYVNQKYRVIEGLNEPILRQENPQKVMELYGKLFSDLGLIDSFATENPFNFNRDELDIIKSWKNFVKERFL